MKSGPSPLPVDDPSGAEVEPSLAALSLSLSGPVVAVPPEFDAVAVAPAVVLAVCVAGPPSSAPLLVTPPAESPSVPPAGMPSSLHPTIPIKKSRFESLATSVPVMRGKDTVWGNPAPKVWQLSPELTGEHASAQKRPGSSVWGGHELLSPLARGGMAELFVARPAGENLERRVALKRMLPRFRRDLELRRQFENEVCVTSALQHPCLPHLYTAGYVGDEPFFTMELLRGETLLDVLRRSTRYRQPIPFGVAIYIASRLASALHHAHEARDRYGHPLGIVHRDVSPGNVIIRDDGQVCLIDFGVARNTTVSITEAGVIKGKVSYMSPEQCWGHKVDRRSDIFTLGIVMYEMTTGRRLFRNGDVLGTITKVMQGGLPSPSQHRDPFPHELEAIITKALHPDVEERFATAAQMQYELERTAARAGLWLSELEVRAYVAHLKTFGPVRRAKEARSFPRLVAERPTEKQAVPGRPRRRRPAPAPVKTEIAIPVLPPKPRVSRLVIALFIVPWILALLAIAAIALGVKPPIGIGSPLG